MASDSGLGLTIPVTVEVGNSLKNIQTLTSSFEKLRMEMNKAPTKYGFEEGSFVRSVKQISNGTIQVQAYNQGLNHTQTVTLQTNAALAKLANGEGAASKGMQLLVANEGKWSTSMNQTASSIEVQNRELNRQRAQYDNLTNKINLYLQSYQKIASDKSLYGQFNNLASSCQKGTISIQAATGEFHRLQTAAKDAGLEAKSFGQIMSVTLSSRIRNSVISMAFMAVSNSLRSLKNNIVDVDDALTQLRIVTGASENELAKYFDDAAEAAQNCASTIVDMMGSTETYSRLGYSLDESLGLATITNEFKNVANIDEDSATTAMTSILKGYNLSADDAERVGDELTLIGQSYAISASELGEALENGGATLAVANTSLEESIALMAAGNAAIQDASKVGNALKTSSMRIRGATAELEEEGEDTSDVKTTSKLQAEVKALTNGNVSLLDEEGAYRSIYDILVDIAGVWDDMSDLNQAALLEDIAGKRNASTIASIINNLGDLEGAYADAQNAEGTLANANDIYLNSISGKTAQLSSAWQTFSADLIDSDLIKWFVDLGTQIVNVLDKITNLSSVGKGGLIALSAALLSLTQVKSLKNFSRNLEVVSTSIEGVGASSTMSFKQLLQLEGAMDKMSKSQRKIANAGIISGLDEANAALVNGSRGITNGTATFNVSQMAKQGDDFDKRMAEEIAYYSATQKCHQEVIQGSEQYQEACKLEAQAILADAEAQISLQAADIDTMVAEGQITDADAIMLAQRSGLISQTGVMSASEAQRLGLLTQEEMLTLENANSTHEYTSAAVNAAAAKVIEGDAATTEMSAERKEYLTKLGLIDADGKLINTSVTLSTQQAVDLGLMTAKEAANNKETEATYVLTKAKIDEMVAQGKMNEKTAQAIVANFNLAESEEAATLSADHLRKMLNTVKKDLQKFFTSTGGIVATVAAIAVGITAAVIAISEKLHNSTEEIKESLDELQEGIESEESELEELKAQSDSVNESIDELMSKGELSITDKNDLANLQAENDLLEQQIKLKELELEKDQEEAKQTADDLYKSLDDSTWFGDTTVYSNNKAGGTSGFMKRFGNWLAYGITGGAAGFASAPGASEYLDETYKSIVGSENSMLSLSESFQMLDAYSEESLSNMRTNLTEIADELITVAEGGGKYADEAQEELERISEIYDRINQYMGFSISSVAEEWHTALSSIESDDEDLNADSLIQSFEDSLDDEDFAKKFADWVDDLSDEDREVVALLTLDTESATWDLEDWIQEFNNTEVHLVPLITDEANSNTNYEKAESMIQNNSALRGQVNTLVEANNGNTTLMAQELNDTSKYKEIQNMLNECDMSAEQFTQSLYQGTLESKEKLDELVGSLENVADAMESIPTISDVWTDFSDIESGIEGLSDALAEFQDEGMITLSTISSLNDTFGELDGWEDFLNVALDTSSSLDDVQAALDSLLSTYLQDCELLQDVNEETVDNIAYLLEQAGVANGTEVAYRQLAVQMVEAAVDEGTFTDATIDAINAMLEEQGVSGDLSTAIQDLAVAYENYQKAMTKISESETGQRLKNLGIEIQEYASAQELYNSVMSSGKVNDNSMSKSYWKDETNKIWDEYASAQAELDKAISNLSGGGTYSVSPTNQKSSSSSSSSSSSTSSTTYDWIEVKLDKLSQKTDDLIDKNDRLFNYSSKNSALSQAYKNVEKEIDANTTAYNKYMQKANSVGLSKTWRERVQNGSYSISEVTNDTLKEQIEEYQEWYDKAQDCKSAVQDLKDQLKEIAKMQFDNVIDMYDTIGSYRSSVTGVTESKINLREAKGDTSSKTYQNLLKEQKKNMNSELKNLQDELDAAQKTYNKNASKMAKEDQYAAKEQINEIKSSIYDLQADLVELDQTIQDAKNALLETEIDYYQSVVDKNEARLDYRASLGYSVTNDTYESILNNEKDAYQGMIDAATEERKNLRKQLNAGGLTKQESYELRTQINELTADIYGYKTSIEELNQAIDQINFDKLDNSIVTTTNTLTKLQDRMSLHEAMGYSETSQHYISELEQEQEKYLDIADYYQQRYNDDLTMRNSYSKGSDLWNQWNDQYLSDYQSYTETMSSYFETWYEELTIPITKCGYEIERLTSKLDLLESSISLMQHEGVTTDNFNQIAESTRKEMDFNTKQYSTYQSEIDTLTETMQEWLQETHGYTWNGDWGELETTASLKSDYSKGQYTDETQTDHNAVTVNSDEFMEIWNAYYDALTAQNELLEENLDLADDLRELYFDTYFTAEIDAIQACADKLDALVSLFSSFSTNTSTGQLTTQGMAQLSINLSNIDRMREEAQTIASEIDTAIAMYNDPDNWNADGTTVNFSASELEEQLDDLSQQYLEVASSVETYRDSIISLCEDAMQAQLDYTEKVIDGISDTIQAEKDLYDYNKSLTEKSKNVTDIQAQIDAYTNVDTAEAKAKLAQLYADLDEAQEEYDEAVKEHTYDLQIEGLDDLKTDLEEAYDEMIELLSTSLDEQNNLISSIDTLVAGTGEAITDWLNKFAEVLGVDWYYAGISTDNNTVTSVAGVSTGGVIDEPKNIQGFSTGGVVSDITKIVAKNGDDSIVSVKRGETVLTDAFTKLLPKSVDVMNTFNEIKNGNNSPCEALTDGMKDMANAMQGVHKEMSVDLHFDNLLNVEGSVDATVVDDLKQFSKDLYQDFTSQLTNEFVKLGYRR